MVSSNSTYLGVDALGRIVGVGDLVASTMENDYGVTGRKTVQGIVYRMTAKSFNLKDDNGNIITNRRSKKPESFRNYNVILLSHANDIDKYKQLIVEWEEENKEGLGS